MGLIAKEIEGRGIPTICLSSALSITKSVNPPRAIYVDYPLGHTAGKPNDKKDQEYIMKKALAAIQEISKPGEIIDLGLAWSQTDDWKDTVMRPYSKKNKSKSDDRIKRYDTPQYQIKADAELADPYCPTCVFFEK